MTEANDAKLTGTALAELQHRRDTGRHVAEVVAATDSPAAMEATLSEIADEVMQEAIERRRLAALGR